MSSFTTNTETKPIYSRTFPLTSTIKNRQLLTAHESTKATYHVVLDLKEEPLPFKVGDSIAVYPQNNRHLVDHLIKVLQATGNETIVDPRSQIAMTLKDFLTHKANLGRVTSSFLKLIHEYETRPHALSEIQYLLDKENKAALSDYLLKHDAIDLFSEYRHLNIPLQSICDKFSPLLPRFYSIASSPYLYPNEIHLTIALFSFKHGEDMRFGVASHFLTEGSDVDLTPIPIYVQPNHSGFTLPEDPSTPIIMIGPGTGIAPFKAFIEERIHLNHSGKNWLFFGARNASHDFLYKDFLLNAEKQGSLKLSLAFSRDQAHKIYVQHRMLEEAKTLWAWIQEGAHIYICGDASQMAKDVEKAFLTIFIEQGMMSEEDAQAYFKQLKASKRLSLDIY